MWSSKHPSLCQAIESHLKANRHLSNNKSRYNQASVQDLRVSQAFSRLSRLYLPQQVHAYHICTSVTFLASFHRLVTKTKMVIGDLYPIPLNKSLSLRHLLQTNRNSTWSFYNMY